jgi:hypothetical protein
LCLAGRFAVIVVVLRCEMRTCARFPGCDAIHVVAGQFLRTSQRGRSFFVERTYVSSAGRLL